MTALAAAAAAAVRRRAMVVAMAVAMAMVTVAVVGLSPSFQGAHSLRCSYKGADDVRLAVEQRAQLLSIGHSRVVVTHSAGVCHEDLGEAVSHLSNTSIAQGARRLGDRSVALV